MIKLITLKQLARFHHAQCLEGEKAAFVTCDNQPPCLLFRTDLDAIAREVTISYYSPELQKNPTARTLVKLLMQESEIGIDALQGAVLDTNAFRKANQKKFVGEIPFPIKHAFHFSL